MNMNPKQILHKHKLTTKLSCVVSLYVCFFNFIVLWAYVWFFNCIVLCTTGPLYYRLYVKQNALCNEKHFKLKSYDCHAGVNGWSANSVWYYLDSSAKNIMDHIMQHHI